MKLKISNLLLKRLERVRQQCTGCLFGIFYGESTLLLLGFNVEETLDKLNYEQIQHKFPAEFDLCGLVQIGESTDTDARRCELLKNVDITDNPILFQVELGNLVRMRASMLMHGKLQEISYELVTTEQLYQDFCFTRLKCRLELITSPDPTALKHDMQTMRKQLASGSLVFKIATPEINVNGAGVTAPTGCDIKTESRIDELIKVIVESQTPAGEAKKDKKQQPTSSLASTFGALCCDYEVINIQALRCKTRDPLASVDGQAPAPAFSVRFTREKCPKVVVPLEVDALAILYKGTRLYRLYDVLIESVCRLLRLFEQSLLLQLSGSGKLSVPRCYHFFPKDFGHFLTLSYLSDLADSDETMLALRRDLHRRFGLPLNRPYFVRGNRCRFYDEPALRALKTDGPLLNTHQGLRPSGVVDGTPYLVQGNYQYYHYLQQGMPDNGWGCAYRSLQTICSWFALQGYTTRTVPTHREIQQYLASIGDKPATFVDSKQWIGSTEVSMCLQGFLNVDSRIMHLSSGAEMATVGPELASHFQRQGTPVMIGGGVLAHTIIGIDYAMQSGDIKFLILDPHYTGADELSTIQAKGWCGWKGLEFWQKSSYYNLCLPQLPNTF